MPIQPERVWTSALKLGRAWGPTVLIVAVSVSAGAILAEWRAPGPASPASERLSAIGRAYPRELGAAYAQAWLKGAEALDGGRAVSDSLGVVAQEWTAGRTALFDRAVAPEFSAVIPEGKPEGEISSAEKAALASLWRAFAAGLAEPGK